MLCNEISLLFSFFCSLISLVFFSLFLSSRFLLIVFVDPHSLSQITISPFLPLLSHIFFLPHSTISHFLSPFSHPLSLSLTLPSHLLSLFLQSKIMSLFFYSQSSHILSLSLALPAHTLCLSLTLQSHILCFSLSLLISTHISSLYSVKFFFLTYSTISQSFSHSLAITPPHPTPSSFNLGRNLSVSQTIACLLRLFRRRITFCCDEVIEKNADFF